MKKKILVPMFASVMALSMNSISNADEVQNNKTENDKDNNNILKLDEYKETSYKVASVKDGVAVKVRSEGSVQTVAYTGDEFKVLGTQGEWVKISLGDEDGWIAKRFVDIKEAKGYTTENKVNFRKEANTNSDVIEELETGSTFKVLEDDGKWAKVKKGEQEGYVRSLYLSDKAPVIEDQEAITAHEVDNNSTISTANNTVDISNDENKTSQESTKNQIKNDSQNTYNKYLDKQSNSNNNNSSQSIDENENIQSTNENIQAESEKEESYNPPASNQSVAQAVVNLAYAKLGSPYVWGAEGPNSFDCSGLTSYVYKNAAGVSLPRSSSAQSGYGITVSRSNLKAGDLVFFTTNGTGNVSHVGIYVGGGNMVHSPRPGKSVEVVSVNSSYYSSRFVTAKRVL